MTGIYEKKGSNSLRGLHRYVRATAFTLQRGSLGIYGQYEVIGTIKDENQVIMKMPSVKYYHNRAKTLGVLVVFSLFGYFVIRFMIYILC